MAALSRLVVAARLGGAVPARALPLAATSDEPTLIIARTLAPPGMFAASGAPRARPRNLLARAINHGAGPSASRAMGTHARRATAPGRQIVNMETVVPVWVPGPRVLPPHKSRLAYVGARRHARRRPDTPTSAPRRGATRQTALAGPLPT